MVGNPYIIPYVGDDVNHTLTRGERWSQNPSIDLPIVLNMRFVLLVRPYYDTKVSPSHFLMLMQGNSTDLD